MPDEQASPEHTIKVALDTAEAATQQDAKPGSGPAEPTDAEKRRAEMAKAAETADKPTGTKGG